MERLEEAYMLLESLGNTPDEIAAKLKNEGILGIVEDCGRCPLARYGQKKGFALQTDGVNFWLGNNFQVDTKLPKQCQEFAELFDGTSTYWFLLDYDGSWEQ